VYSFLRQLRKAFPKHILDYQLLDVTEEHKHNYGQPAPARRISQKKE
jgi:hypothetical protein